MSSTSVLRCFPVGLTAPPHSQRLGGAYSTVRSTFSGTSRCAPSWPGLRPGLRPLAPRLPSGRELRRLPRSRKPRFHSSSSFSAFSSPSRSAAFSLSNSAIRSSLVTSRYIYGPSKQGQVFAANQILLPSEAEWLYAAEGGAEQRVYPWGANDPGTLNQYAIYGCHYPDGSGVCGPLFNNLAPVGTATLGAGRWGQLDLAGGVLQCVLDLMQPRPGGYMVDPCVDCGSVVSPFGDEQGDITSRIYWGSTFHSAPATLYQGWATYGWATLNRVFDIGFRCARSP